MTKYAQLNEKKSNCIEIKKKNCNQLNEHVDDRR